MNKNDLLVDEYNLRIDIKGDLYHKDSIVFGRNDKFEFCIYELFKNRYLVISAFSKENFNSNYSYMLPKSEIIVIDLIKWDKLHSVNIDNKFLYDIYYDEDENLILKAIDKVYKFELGNNSDLLTD